MIEVELRAFVSESKYNALLNFFKENAVYKGTQKQITSYFDCEKDLRLMVTDDNYCQLWLKKGKIHQDAREELIVKVDKSYKDILLKMFEEIGLNIKIKWYRIRKSYEWNNIKVDLDFTYGYGHILELEILVEDTKEVENAKTHLKEIFKSLEIPITEKEIFTEKFNDYEINWAAYTKDLTEDNFMNL